MFMVLLIGIISCLFSLGLRYLYISIYKKNEVMKRNCTSMVNGTFIKFVEKEVRSRFDDSVPIYDKWFYPVYEYYVNEKRYEVQSIYGNGKADESLLEKNKVVCYNPSKFEESFIKDENPKVIKTNFKILQIVFLILGIFWIFLYFVLKLNIK